MNDPTRRNQNYSRGERMNENDVRRQLQEMMQNVQGRIVDTVDANKKEWLESFKSAATWALVGAISCWLMKGFFWRSGWGRQYEIMLFIGLVLLSCMTDNFPGMRKIFPYRGLANFAIGCVGADSLWSLLLWLARVES